MQLFHDQPIHGPYKQSAREDWLKRLLEAQAWIRENGPEYVRSLDLVTLAELEEIRRIWVVEKHEFVRGLIGNDILLTRSPREPIINSGERIYSVGEVDSLVRRWGRRRFS